MRSKTISTSIILALAAMIIFAGSNVSAQTVKRIGLAEGADSVEVSGKIAGKQYVIYEIWSDKGDTWWVDLQSPNKYVGWSVKGPNGDRYDLLEASPVSGYYKIRVDLNAEGARSKKSAGFKLKVNFDLKPGKPISDEL